MTTSPADRAFKKFLDTLEEQRSRQERRHSVEVDIINAKDRKLIPIRQLLKRLRDMNLVVSNASRYTGGVSTANLAPVSFDVSEDASSPRWQPGNSLFIDHPAELEIAIPNPKDVAEVGEVVISCSTHHPDQDLLRGPFRSMEEACDAMAEFIARNTEHVGLP